MLFVRVQVSLPYMKIDYTSARKTLILFDRGNLEVQMPLSLWHAIQACTFRALTSFAHVMSLSSQLPRYFNSLTFVSGAPLRNLRPSSSAEWLNTMYSVFVSFKCRPISADSFSTLSTRSCACAISSELSAMASAKSRSLMTTVGVLLLLLPSTVNPKVSCWSPIACLVQYSNVMAKMYGREGITLEDPCLYLKLLCFAMPTNELLIEMFLEEQLII